MEMLIIVGIILLSVWSVVGIMAIIMMISYVQMLKNYPKVQKDLLNSFLEDEEA